MLHFVFLFCIDHSQLSSKIIMRLLRSVKKKKYETHHSSHILVVLNRPPPLVITPYRYVLLLSSRSLVYVKKSARKQNFCIFICSYTHGYSKWKRLKIKSHREASSYIIQDFAGFQRGICVLVVKVRSGPKFDQQFWF